MLEVVLVSVLSAVGAAICVCCGFGCIVADLITTPLLQISCPRLSVQVKVLDLWTLVMPFFVHVLPAFGPAAENDVEGMNARINAKKSKRDFIRRAYKLSESKT